MSTQEGWHLNGGLYVAAPRVFGDRRGSFQEVFRESLLPVGAQPFGVQQASRTLSHRGVLRGLHVTDVPPGQAKHVTCVSGRALDVVVDVRVGSPSFGEHAAIELDADGAQSIYIAHGMAHGYVALDDGTSILYLHDAEYAPEHDKDLQAIDPALGIDWPVDEPIRSAKDAAAPTLAESLERGLLPHFAPHATGATR